MVIRIRGHKRDVSLAGVPPFGGIGGTEQASCAWSGVPPVGEFALKLGAALGERRLAQENEKRETACWLEGEKVFSP
jgi:hypothetical protein